MKSVFILQNSPSSFGLDISKIYNPKKYNLYFIVNKFGFNKLKEKEQTQYFFDIYVTEDFSFEKVKNIISNTTDFSKNLLEIVTSVEEAISLCGNLRVYFKLEENNFDRFTDKGKMKSILKNSEILFPKYALFEKETFAKNPINYLNYLTKSLNFPMFVKPIDQVSCRGASKIYNKHELEKWCNNVLTSSFEYEIDEFIEGTLFHCDSYIKNSQIIFTQVSECSRPCFDFIEGKTKGSIALPHTDENFLLLTKYTHSVFNVLSIPKNGVTHLEVFKTENGDLIFLEIAYRSPGILIPAMYKKYLDIDTAEAHILLQIDESYKPNINKGFYAAWVAFPTQQGIVKSFNSLEIKSKHEINWVVKPGDKLNHPTIGRDYAGTALLWNESYKQLHSDFNYLNNFIPFSV